MTRRARWSPLAAALASAALLAPFGATAAPAAAAPPARPATNSVSITVDDVTTTTLNPTSTLKPLAVTLSLTNTSAQDIYGITVEGERGDPISSQSRLDKTLTQGQPSPGSIVPIVPTHPVKLDLPAGGTEQVVFRTTSSLSTSAGLCTCAANAVYPLYFTAHASGPGGVDQSFGVGSTFVSSFFDSPAPVRVSWVWPLIDQPHLLSDTPAATGGPVFRDDFLSASVSSGGRLDRALSVVEQVEQDGSAIPLTLVVDPELLDELQLMASGPYRVQSGATHTVPGTGQRFAAAWLQRLRAVLGTHPEVRLELTAYADPDVESLASNGLHWTNAVPTTRQKNVDLALGGHAGQSTIAWPPGGALSAETLDQLVSGGVSTLLLNSTSVTPRPAARAVRPGLARLSARNQDVAAALLSATTEKYVSRTLTAGGPGTAALPQLAAELAVQAAQEPTVQHATVLVAPRWVDPAVGTAVRVLEETSRSLYTRPIALSDAVGGELLPNGRSHLAAVPASARTLPRSSLAAAREVHSRLPGLTSLLTPVRPQTIDPQAKTLLLELPVEAQRATASAWGRADNALSAAQYAGALTNQLNGITDQVTIVKPSAGSYTLASDNSPLPITVDNRGPYQVTVMIRVQAVNGLPGFTAKPMRAVVGAHQKATVHLPTNVDRTGRIRVQAALFTPDDRHRVGDWMQLTVRSTALGVIGVVITIGAGAVLALALIVRFGRRLRRRVRKDRPRRPRFDPDAPDADRRFEAAMHPAEPRP